MRILVTGGAGFIGSHLVDRLVSDTGVEVFVLDNLHSGSTENLRQSWNQIRFVEGDIRDSELLCRLMPGKDAVMHFAAQSNVLGADRDLEYSFTTNVAGTFNVLRAAEQAHVGRVVFASSREVYGEPKAMPVSETTPLEPKNAYGASKLAGEVYCRAFAARGLHAVVLRLANVYGSRDQGRVIPVFIDNAIQGKPLILNGGDQILDFIHVDTVTEVLCKACFGVYLSEPVNIGSGIGITIKDVAQLILNLAGSFGATVCRHSNPLEVGRFVADTTRLCSHFGVSPPKERMPGLEDLILARKGLVR
ncbi:MAG: NAD-dependent epimerase/dehydratase family protein [Acidobacteriia bacterium]|nr:NAD-dependent epimerase/dehydratase family protein [Terriglobia bacterium]